jgi:tocopherol O-methyltransferase
MTPHINVDRHTPISEDVVAYYDETWLDYRLLWLNRQNLSVHFGYTDATTHGHADALLNMNRVLADRAGIGPGQRVLDAGCGVGGSSMWLATQRRAEVVGITLVRSQLERARRFVTARGLAGRVAFQLADYTGTPFPDASFDAVWAIESVCHAPDKSAFYREAARLLRPGGRLVVAEFIRAARPLSPTGERLLHEWLDGWAIPDLDTRAEHAHYARAAGLADFQLDDVTAHTRPSLRRLYRMTFWSYPLAMLGRAVGIRSTVQHGNVIGSLRQYQALERGCWFYGILTARKPC